MSLVPVVIAAVQAHVNQSALGGIGGEVLVYVGSFGLIGLIPYLASQPPAKSKPPQWIVAIDDDQMPQSTALRIERSGWTIEGEISEVRSPPQLCDDDPRWGRYEPLGDIGLLLSMKAQQAYHFAFGFPSASGVHSTRWVSSA